MGRIRSGNRDFLTPNISGKTILNTEENLYTEENLNILFEEYFRRTFGDFFWDSCGDIYRDSFIKRRIILWPTLYPSPGNKVMPYFNYKDLWVNFKELFQLENDAMEKLAIELTSKKDFIVNNKQNIVICNTLIRDPENSPKFLYALMFHAIQNFLVNLDIMENYVVLLKGEDSESSPNKLTFDFVSGSVLFDREMSNYYREEELPKDIEFMILDPQTDLTFRKGCYHYELGKHLGNRDATNKVSIILYNGTEEEFKKELCVMGYIGAGRPLKFFSLSGVNQQISSNKPNCGNSGSGNGIPKGTNNVLGDDVYGMGIKTLEHSKGFEQLSNCRYTYSVVRG